MLIGSTEMRFSRPFKNLAKQMKDYKTLTPRRSLLQRPEGNYLQICCAFTVRRDYFVG